MTDDDHDDYLWTAEGPVSLEIAGLERQLRPLRWTPRELSLLAAAAPSIEPSRTTNVAANDTRGWLPLLAGLLAAAAVLLVLSWLRASSEHPSESPSPEPTAQPSGSPPAGDLVDPFGPDAPSFPSPSSQPADLVDPFVEHDPKKQPDPRRRPISPDLKDPFANSPPAADPAPRREHAPSPDDLMDPFADDDAPSAPRESGKLHDPFTGEQQTPPQSSPDLKDPFRR